MNMRKRSSNVQECKIQAAILLKSLRSDNPSIAQTAAKRFRCLHEFKDLSIDDIMLVKVQLKQALTVIAIEKGFASWVELQCQLPFIRGGFLNHWFADYRAARDYLEQNGGYLLPYQRQFFVCSRDYIEVIGLDSTDPDWQLIGYDWAKPANKEAWQRLCRQWKNALKKTGGIK